MRPFVSAAPIYCGMQTVILLTLSNVFMTFAWYYHCKSEHLKNGALWLAILASWGIAFFEYCFQVPANRLGNERGMSIAQLKVLQEVITLCVFVAFSVLYLGAPIRWNHLAGFALIVVAAFLIFLD